MASSVAYAPGAALGTEGEQRGGKDGGPTVQWINVAGAGHLLRV